MAAAGAASALALEASSQRKVSTVALSFDDFVTAFDLAVTYEATYMIWWMADYVRHGFTARSLGARLGHLRRTASQRAMAFPLKDSPAWARIKDTERALKKVDPTEPSRATVIGLFWIEKVLDALGIFELADYRDGRSSAADCQLAVRALLAHAGMLRGCEHRSGLLLSDVVTVADSHLQISIAARYSEKKMKTRAGRKIILPIENGRWSAGAAMVEYISRFHSGGGGDARLFFDISDAGFPLRHRARSDKDFMNVFKPLVASVGLPPKDVKRVTNHSFRAGGATDYFVSGMSAESIKAQGGWTTYCFLIYVRPAAEHIWRVAARMVTALSGARQRPPAGAL